MHSYNTYLICNCVRSRSSHKLCNLITYTYTPFLESFTVEFCTVELCVFHGGIISCPSFSVFFVEI